MQKAKITFNNGFQLEAEQNASSFITDTKPDFPAGLSNVTVSSEEFTTSYQHAEIIECASVDGRYWFALREVPESERRERQMQADIDYLAAMSGVNLEV